MAVLKAENLKHVYSAGTPFESVGIHDISLSIGQGERICLLGHTGSGKSTFVQHLNALLQPTSGSVAGRGGYQPQQDLPPRCQTAGWPGVSISGVPAF